MKTAIHPERIRKIAGFELNALRYLDVLPADVFEGAKLVGTGIPIHDLNGQVLFHRIPLSANKSQVAYVDMAADTRLGAPVLSVSFGQVWDDKAILREAAARVQRLRKKIKYDTMRFVAYSYPKIAVQFLAKKKEVLMMECFTWQVVSKVSRRDFSARKKMQPGNFERWSLLDELADKTQQKNKKRFTERTKQWDVVARRKKIKLMNIDTIKLSHFDSIVKKISLMDTRTLHYSLRNTDHHPCYELRGQETNVWCVGASTQMLLDFYRYEYSQVRLAEELGLGTLDDPNGLPYARVGDVVTVIEAMTANALNATMITNPSWSTFRNEIRANRPLISFVPGHSRTVAGYTRSRFTLPGAISFRGLLVYDPWPPNAGVITRWENFATQTYQYAYTARVTKV